MTFITTSTAFEQKRGPEHPADLDQALEESFLYLCSKFITIPFRLTMCSLAYELTQ